MIYAPDEERYWYHQNLTDFFPRKTANRIELDHIAIQISDEDTSPPYMKGNDIQHIDERIFTDSRVTGALKEKIRVTLNKIKPHPQTNPDKWRATWETIKTEARVICLRATKNRQYRESAVLKKERQTLADMRDLERERKREHTHT
jgi:hypothetical protein